MIDDSYLAGFFDGEGCVGFVRWPYFVPRSVSVQVVNSNEWVIKQYQLAFGGSISRVNSQSEKWQVAFRWFATGKNAKQAIEALLPYLIIKKPQAELALAFLRDKRDCRGLGKIPEAEYDLRKSYGKQMAILNKRGKEA